VRIISVISIINEKETVNYHPFFQSDSFIPLGTGNHGKKIYSSLWDFYSKETERKAKQHYGSDNFFINIEQIWTL